MIAKNLFPCYHVYPSKLTPYLLSSNTEDLVFVVLFSSLIHVRATWQTHKWTGQNRRWMIRQQNIPRLQLTTADLCNAEELAIAWTKLNCIWITWPKNVNCLIYVCFSLVPVAQTAKHMALHLWKCGDILDFTKQSVCCSVNITFLTTSFLLLQKTCSSSA